MNRKTIIGLIVLALILTIVSINVVKLNTDKKEAAALEVQKKKDEKYFSATYHFYDSTTAYEFISSSQLSTYSIAWKNAIQKQEDFSLAVNTEITKSNDTIQSLTGIYEKLGKDLKVVSEAAKEQPEKYKETYEEYKKLYGIITVIHEQVQSPSGSLLEFNKNTNNLQQEYKKIRGNIEITIPDEIKKEHEKRIKENGDSSSSKT
ncbi:hypothetical protein [Bacillus thuringiensis]|uniref:hypothetical protein n=1 Tax=Bacillus thuringiensis TaxID=1428 RepID=UPI000A395117|nr:hypothetical protein [Bacillus thuringiensis]OUA86558.1 hypothetical protein BK706_21100 [Bacillus thuringiensis serovar leesis]